MGIIPSPAPPPKPELEEGLEVVAARDVVVAGLDPILLFGEYLNTLVLLRDFLKLVRTDVVPLFLGDFFLGVLLRFLLVTFFFLTAVVGLEVYLDFIESIDSISIHPSEFTSGIRDFGADLDADLAFEAVALACCVLNSSILSSCSERMQNFSAEYLTVRLRSFCPYFSKLAFVTPGSRIISSGVSGI
jgi:hypothetical protein